MSLFRQLQRSMELRISVLKDVDPFKLRFHFFLPHKPRILPSLSDEDKLVQRIRPCDDRFVGLWSDEFRRVVAVGLTSTRKFDPEFEYFSWFEITRSWRKQRLTPWLIHEFLLEVGAHSKKPVKVWPIAPSVKLSCYTMDGYGYKIEKKHHFLVMNPPPEGPDIQASNTSFSDMLTANACFQ